MRKSTTVDLTPCMPNGQLHATGCLECSSQSICKHLAAVMNECLVHEQEFGCHFAGHNVWQSCVAEHACICSKSGFTLCRWTFQACTNWQAHCSDCDLHTISPDMSAAHPKVSFERWTSLCHMLVERVLSLRSGHAQNEYPADEHEQLVH